MNIQVSVMISMIQLKSPSYFLCALCITYVSISQNFSIWSLCCFSFFCVQHRHFILVSLFQIQQYQFPSISFKYRSAIQIILILKQPFFLVTICQFYYNKHIVMQVIISLQTNFIRMQTQYVNPKLLFEFYKTQKVPPLVKKYDFETHFKQSLLKSRKQQPDQHKDQISRIEEDKSAQLDEVCRQLERQIQQNRELRLIIKQLEQKIQHLVDVNQKLCTRAEDLEKRNQNYVESSQNGKKQLTRKVRLQVYKEVQEYLRMSVQKFTQIMLPIKMSPVIENKLESFLQEILNINNMSVRLALNPEKQGISKNRVLFDEKQAERTIKSIIQNHSKSKSKEKIHSVPTFGDSSNYGPILSKLRQNSGMKPGTIVTRPPPAAGSPNKTRSSRRTRIFNTSTESPQWSPNRPVNRRLDF